MRTNIDIDDKLMNYVMALGDFRTKREAVEAGLQLIKRRHAYAAIRAARGTLFWDDSDEAWARSRAELEAQAAAAQAGQIAASSVDQAEEAAEFAVHEPAAVYAVTSPPTLAPKPQARVRRKASPGASS
jgi:Arc/MetJ family transcription regulator